MKIVFTARRGRINTSVRALVEKKIAKLEKVLPPNAVAHYTMEGEGKGVAIELTVSGRNRTLKAHAMGEDQDALAHEVLEKLENQVRRTKSRVKEVKKRGPSPAETAEALAPPVAEEPPPTPAVRRERITPRHQFEEDALIHFAAGTHLVHVFRDAAADNALRVLYRRADGRIGLVIPVIPA